MSQADFDAVIVGGGVVGAAAALGLKQAGRRVLLIEARPPRPWAEDDWDARVYALSPASIKTLDTLGIWADVPRPQAFTAMQVWDQSSALNWSAEELGVQALGAIVEDAALLRGLWPQLASVVRCPAAVTAINFADDHVSIRVDDDELSARLLIAADGARSPIRKQLGIPVSAKRYPARAVVAHVQCTLGHADTAWQRFAPTGPIGLLPLADSRLSVVWSLDVPDDARVLAMDDKVFCAALSEALDGRLGQLSEPSARVSFPLHLRHAVHYVQGRVALLGDAAHSLHPLAGQGLNLGLADVQALLDAVAAVDDPGDAQALAHFARSTRAANARMLALTDSLYRLFGARDPLLRALRGWGMNTLNHMPAIKSQLAIQALGIAPASQAHFAPPAG